MSNQWDEDTSLGLEDDILQQEMILSKRKRDIKDNIDL
jgi:hypothetical protein